MSKLIFLCVSLSGFFVLAGYNFIRSVAVPVFIESYGKESLVGAQAVMGILLIGTLYLYNHLLSRIGARRTLFYTQLFFALFFALGTFGAHYHWGPLIYAINVFKEIYIVMIVEQVWSYFNSTFHGEKHKFYVGIMTGIASIGPILSGFGASWISEYAHPHWLFLLTGIFLLPSLFLMNYAYLKSPVDEVKPKKDEERFGLREFSKFPILKLLMLFVVLSQILSTVSMLNFQISMANEFPDVAKQTSQYGIFYSYINLYAGILQFLAAPILLHYLSAGWLVLLVISVNVFLQLNATINPTFSSVMYAILIFKSMDYSLFRCVKETFYESLSFDARYRSKQLIDVLGYRVSGSLFNTSLGAIKMIVPAIEHTLPWWGVSASLGWLLSFGFLSRPFQLFAKPSRKIRSTQ